MLGQVAPSITERTYLQRAVVRRAEAQHRNLRRASPPLLTFTLIASIQAFSMSVAVVVGLTAQHGSLFIRVESLSIAVGKTYRDEGEEES